MVLNLEAEENQPWAWANNYGYVKSLYPDLERTLFQLMDGKISMNPKEGWFYITKYNNDNYQAQVDLLYMAFKERYKIYVRTEPKLDKLKYAVVRYLLVDWQLF